jgi:hypothetical protein
MHRKEEGKMLSAAPKIEARKQRFENRTTATTDPDLGRETIPGSNDDVLWEHKHKNLKSYCFSRSFPAL